MLRATLKGTLYITFSLALVKLLSLVYTSMIARALGPEGLGALNLAMLMVPWFIAGSSFSLQTVATQVIASFKSRKLDIIPVMRGLFLLTFLSGLGATLLHFFVSPFVARFFFHDDHLAWPIALASLIILFSVLYNVLLGVERGLKRFRSYAFLEFLKQIFLVVATFCFIVYFGYGVKGALYALIFSPALVIFLYLLRHRRLFAHGAVNKEGMLSFGFSLTFVGLLLSLFLSLDRFILGFLQSQETVGYYAASLTLLNLGFYFVGGIKNTAFPFLSEKFSQTKNLSDHRVIDYFSKITTYTLLFIGVIMIGLMMFRHELIFLIFGSDYYLSIDLLMIMIFSLPFLTLYILIHTLSISIQRIREATLASAIALIVGVVIFYIFTRTWNVTGTAYALVVSSMILSIFYYILTMTSVRIRFAPVFFVVLYVTLFTFALSFVEGSFLFRVFIFLFAHLVYLLLSLLFRFIEWAELLFAFSRISAYFRSFIR